MGSFNIGNLFSGFSSGSSILSGDLLSQYNSIRNGSYRKLAKAYYAKEKTEATSSKSDKTDKTDKKTKAAVYEPDEMTKKNGILSRESSMLSESIEKLSDSSLWEKKQIKVKDSKTGEETEKEDYDWTSITSKVKSFVDNYNRVMDDAADTGNNDVIFGTHWMSGISSENKKELEKIGITVSKDNRLILDEDKLKKSDIATVKKLFSGNDSYAAKLSEKVDDITKAATRKGSYYTSTGRFTTYYANDLSGDKYNQNV